MSKTFDIPQKPALFRACEANDVSVVSSLIDSSTIESTYKGYTPLHAACNHNSLEVAKYLIEKGADVNASNDKTSILHTTCKNGSYPLTALLIKHGANVNATNKLQDGLMPLRVCSQKKEKFELFLLVYLSNTSENIRAVLLDGMLTSYAGCNLEAFFLMVQLTVAEFSGKKMVDMSKRQLSYFAPSEVCNFDKLKTLNLSYNYLKAFPRDLKRMNALTTLDVSHNEIAEIPHNLTTILPNLQTLDISNNQINVVPHDVTGLTTVNLSNNPLASIPHVFRDDNSKVLFYAKHGGKLEPWRQVKIMLVGHEGVGKTTFLKALQGQTAPAVKNPNVSTNGVDISHVKLSSFSNESIVSRLTKKKEKIVLNVWDFGGQAVFHSTHRFFLTSSAIYIVVYNLADESTHSRLEHWMQQITSIIDTTGNSMPILLVGTHADKLNVTERDEILSRINKTYPVSKKCTGVQGHFAVSLSTRNDEGLQDLKDMIVKISKDHPKLGIGQVQVPSFLLLIKEKLQVVQQTKKYLEWNEYKALCQEEFPIVEWTLILQDLGVLVWNNTAKLRDIVIINPQWLADALAGVVTMVNQGSIAKNGGVARRSKLYAIMKTKISEEVLFPIIFTLLERFEIILRMRNYYAGLTALLEDGATFTQKQEEEDIKYFVPSLLLSYDPKKDLVHPAMQFWKRISLKGYTMLKRRFTFRSYPANFFPRLLLRLMHMQLSLLGSWVDAAVLMSQDQCHYGFINLFQAGNSFILEVTVLQSPKKKGQRRDTEALISELAYAITRLDRDMWENPVQHDIVLCFRPIEEQNERPKSMLNLEPKSRSQLNLGSDLSSLSLGSAEMVIPFVECMNMVAKNEKVVRVGFNKAKLALITPDLSCCHEIHEQSLSSTTEIGRGGFGVVYKATLKDITVSNEPVEVAIKEMQQQANDSEREESGSSDKLSRIYEFQHEMLIMSKVSEHKNLVKLYGVMKAPLRLVMEYVPCGDLHRLIGNESKFDTLGWKWRLKMAIDIACGMSHLHKQTPPICHSDLRAPNIFVASLDENADVVGKVADFGLAQQIFPFSSQILGNIVETAPETWGDDGVTKGAMYDERSDVFSYGVILWYLFGAKTVPDSHSVLSQSSSPLSSVLEVSADSCNPYGHLKDAKGKPLNSWSLRNKIREGERLQIVPSCPQALRVLMADCWQFDATARPFFPFILKRLSSFYFQLFGEKDNYLAQQVSTTYKVTIPPQSTVDWDSLSSSMLLDNWYPKPQVNQSDQGAWTIVSLLLVEQDIWAGTNTGALLIISPTTGKLSQVISLQQSGRVSLLRAGVGCVWASCETEKICIISAQTKYRIAELDNEHPVVCMALSYHHAGPTTPVVWVADSKGYMSLWDLTTAQKYSRFQVMGGTNPPVVKAMSVLHEHMWMAVGSDIVVFETQTLQKVVKSAGKGRINCITTVPSTQQIWTCSKDGWVNAWQLATNSDKSSLTTIQIVNVFSVKHDSEVKFVKELSSTTTPLLSSGHIVAGDFNGVLTMWNSMNNKPIMFPVLPEMKNHSLQCALDAGEFGLWIGTMSTSDPALRFHCNPVYQQNELPAVASNPQLPHTAWTKPTRMAYSM